MCSHFKYTNSKGGACIRTHSGAAARPSQRHGSEHRPSSREVVASSGEWWWGRLYILYSYIVCSQGYICGLYGLVYKREYIYITIIFLYNFIVNVSKYIRLYTHILHVKVNSVDIYVSNIIVCVYIYKWQVSARPLCFNSFY